MHQIDQVLFVDPVETTVVIAGGECRGPLITTAAEEELVTGLRAAKHDIAFPAVEYREHVII
ncbi:hypothetical protein D3C81_1415800 [compost metagenome]